MKLLKNISAIFFAILFLVSSLGFTVNKMICLKSGKTKVSLTNIQACCKKNKSTNPIIKNKCCDIDNSTFSLGDFQYTQKTSVSAAFSFIAVINNYSFLFYGLKNSSSELFYADLPPPFYGRQLLSFISVLTI